MTCRSSRLFEYKFLLLFIKFWYINCCIFLLLDPTKHPTDPDISKLVDTSNSVGSLGSKHDEKEGHERSTSISGKVTSFKIKSCRTTYKLASLQENLPQET